MENNELLTILEEKDGELKDVVSLLFYTIEDYYVPRVTDTQEKALNYDRLETYLWNIYRLLDKIETEINTTVNTKYKELKR